MPASANALAAPRTVSADPHVSLDPLGWLVVVLVAVLLTVLAHAASVRADQAQYHEPSLLTDPAYALEQKHPPPLGTTAKDGVGAAGLSSNSTIAPPRQQKG